MPRIRHIFRWDLDKTYLKTEFDTIRDLVRTARLAAEARENIPGSGALLRAIRDGVPDGSQHLIYFISGSPEQMRSVIEKKFALDGFSPDGFVLKPTVANILRGRFRAVRSQVEYKLAELLTMRGEAPIGTKETLFGDDAENDAFIYSLYADLLAGRVDPSLLRKLMKQVGAYRDQVTAIEEACEAIVHEDVVRRIIIHLDRNTPPVAFEPFFPRVVPIYNHLQTAIILYLDGTLTAESIRHVARELIARYMFDADRLLRLSEDILRRERFQYPSERLERLSAELLSLGPTPHEGLVEEEAIDQSTHSMIERLASLALRLLERTPKEPARPALAEIDYPAMWNREVARHEEAKRQRKEDAKARGRAPQSSPQSPSLVESSRASAPPEFEDAEPTEHDLTPDLGGNEEVGV